MDNFTFQKSETTSWEVHGDFYMYFNLNLKIKVQIKYLLNINFSHLLSGLITVLGF